MDRLVDRALHSVSLRPPHPASAAGLAFARQRPLVDLVVGSVLFRREFVASANAGQVDLPRLREAGVRVCGLTLATRFPDLRGTLSRRHFRSLSLPAAALRSNMATADALIGRIERWAADSDGQLSLVATQAELDRVLATPGAVGAFIGVQGGHVLDGEVGNVERLRARGVRMLALAHVMDNALIGSNTGRQRYALTPFGREVVGALEDAGILVDLAHASSAGIRSTLPHLRRPFVVSHTGFIELAGRVSRWRRYSAATRNLSREDARLVAEAGGLIGIACATRLLGGDGLAPLVRAFSYAADLVGVGHVALGSDFDGALRATFDVTGLPLLAGALLESGFSEVEAAAMLGGNALRLVRGSLDGGER